VTEWVSLPTIMPPPAVLGHARHHLAHVPAVFMDGRSQPREVDPTWFDDSVGRYGKDTL
jgi:hypothetical protein